MEINNASIIITGASRGLGFALATNLAARGANTVLIARDADDLDAAVAHIRAAGHVAHGIAADIGDKRAIHAIAGRAAALVGDIDILINNASTLGPTPLRLLLDTDCEDLEHVLSVNLVGPFRLTKLIAGQMVLRERGAIINISSDAAVEAYASWGAYSASKAALDHMTRVWASELEGTGVRFAAIDPGEMDTRMHAAAIPDADRSTLAKPDAVAARIAALLADRTGAPRGVRIAASEIEAAS